MGLLTSNNLTLKRGAKISDKEFRDLADFIYSLLGIAIPDKRRYLLENRLGSRLEALSLKSFGEYFTYLKHDSGGSAEVDELVEKVTTNETSFFRDMTQMQGFKDKLLGPLLVEREKAGTRSLRIWSAGCSSGEEPYTLAILLFDLLGARLSKWRITITATDVSTSVLEHAKKGVYARYALKTTPPDLAARYFDEDGPRYLLKPEIKKIVRFNRVNLNDLAAMKSMPPSDFIFCRNVIIYFDDDMKKRLMGAFHDNLVPGGSLLLGHSETLHTITRVFTPLPDMGSPVYRKDGARKGLVKRRGG